INEARLQNCLSILKNSSETDQRLNMMNTTMNMFIKDGSAAGVVSTHDQQRLRTEMAQQYLEFDKQAWWWASRLPVEAKLLRIDVDFAKLNSMISEYRANMVTSTEALRALWEHCLSRGYKVTDPRNDGLAQLTKQRLDSLASRRAALIG